MKISFFIFTAICISFPIIISAQSIQNEVIATSGDSFRNSLYELSWTIGECVAETGYVSGLTISQGFHQPYFKFSEIDETDIADFRVVVYPNPAIDLVKLKVHSSHPGETYQLAISDFQGKVLLVKEIVPDDEYVLDLSRFSSQLMIMKVIRKSDHSARTYKIVYLRN